jgi:hydroxysqualene dehydroxylase
MEDRASHLTEESPQHGRGRLDVAVVGGGWAGCAAAVTLARAGVSVTLFEQSPTLGGRARRVTLDGMPFDNGQHVLVGAYRHTLGIIRRMHGGHISALFHRLPLTMRPFGAARSDTVALTAWRAPAPLHLVFGALAADGLTLRERVALISGFRRLLRARDGGPDKETVTQYFADTPLHAIAAVWEPLCISALNTPPESASARIFGNVVREAFGGSSRNSDFLIPAVDLSALFPDAAARYVIRHGGVVRTGATVRAIEPRVSGVGVRIGTDLRSFDATIIAVGPHQLATTIGDDAAKFHGVLSQVSALAYESITTVYLAYAEPVALSVPIMRLDDAPGQWIFDRSAALGAAAPAGTRGLVAVVISTNGPHDTLDRQSLSSAVDAQLRRLARQWPLPEWSRVVAERRATFACKPGLSRPTHGRIAESIYLAGDYTDPALPATLETATKTGVLAARALLADLRVALR